MVFGADMVAQDGDLELNQIDWLPSTQAPSPSNVGPSADQCIRSNQGTPSPMPAHLANQADNPLSEDPPRNPILREAPTPWNRTVRHASHPILMYSAKAANHPDRRRALWGKHIFVGPCLLSLVKKYLLLQMITISATLGIGFYVRSGTILRTAGPLAVFLSFTILTFLAWGVMQGITEMLSIWPVPGALMEFVRYFVDEDLALTVGAAYWSVLTRG